MRTDLVCRRLLVVLTCLLLWPTAGAWAGSAAWSGLSRADQSVLRPVEAQWDTLPAQTRGRLLRLARRYHDLQPAQQARIRERLADWARLTPEQREQARRNYESLQRMSPEQQARFRRQWSGATPPFEEGAPP